jgi:hypothetical protein
MAPFVVSVDTSLPPAQAWARVVDWPRHGAHVPLTTVTASGAPVGPGSVITARTGIGRFGFDDPMEIVAWDPPHDGEPGRCRLEKRGSTVRGWAEITVVPRLSGSRVTWCEEAAPAGLPRFASGAATGVGRVVFGRVLRRLLADP